MAYCEVCGQAVATGDRFCRSCGTVVPQVQAPDTSRYEVLGSLGEGAAGTVHLARDRASGRLVALKVLGPGADTEHLAVEAQVLSSLRHPNVVALYGYETDGARGRLAMEYVEGTSLREVLRQSGPLTPEQALGVLHGSLKGLAAAHGAGVLHGDIKPENILVDRHGTSKLTDFGQAIAEGQAPRGGTPAYLSPEAFHGAPLDARSDLYSMGVVLYECLAGRPPFVATSTPALATMHAQDPPAPIAGLPDGVAFLVDRALAKDPQDRPASAQELLFELEEAARRAYGDSWLARASIATLAAALTAGVGGALVDAAAPGAPAGGARAKVVYHPPATAGPQHPVPPPGHGTTGAAGAPPPRGWWSRLGSTKVGTAIGAHPLLSAGVAAVVVAGAITGGVVAARTISASGAGSTTSSRTTSTTHRGATTTTAPPTTITTAPATTTAPPTTITTDPATTTAPLPQLTAVDSAGQQTWTGREPTTMDFSNDATNIVTNIAWSSWTAAQATGNGTWGYDDCVPDCAAGTVTPYPATIALSQPVNGVFTTMTETASGPDGFSTTFTYPSDWVLGAQ